MGTIGLLYSSKVFGQIPERSSTGHKFLSSSITYHHHPRMHRVQHSSRVQVSHQRSDPNRTDLTAATLHHSTSARRPYQVSYPAFLSDAWLGRWAHASYAFSSRSRVARTRPCRSAPLSHFVKRKGSRLGCELYYPGQSATFPCHDLSD